MTDAQRPVDRKSDERRTRSTPEGSAEVDRPSVPRARRSIIAMILAGFAVLVVGGYSALAFTQTELGAGPERDEIPRDVRASPGGYRSFHFWHSGYHGGK